MEQWFQRQHWHSKKPVLKERLANYTFKVLAVNSDKNVKIGAKKLAHMLFRSDFLSAVYKERLANYTFKVIV